MNIRSALCCAVMIAFTTSTWGASKPAPKKAIKAAPKKVPKTAPKLSPKAAPQARASTIKTAYTKTLEAAQKPTRLPQGKTETLTCREGTEDEHARIGVVLVGGKIDSFAYYSKWKPRTCSIYLQRHRDPYSKWVDKGNVTNVNLERGLFMLEHRTGEYRFVFRDIDRERYCGMEGTINGTLTIRKGSETCELTGIMEEGLPLGQAYAQVEQMEQETPSGVSASVAEAEPLRLGSWWTRLQRLSESVFPSAGVGISD